jgi:5-hydroxyisourate hydrolase-like protein (transthyretin family)
MLHKNFVLAFYHRMHQQSTTFGFIEPRERIRAGAGARKIRLTPTRTLSLKGKVTNAATGQPEPGVTITIEKVVSEEMKSLSTPDLPKNVKRTAAAGGFQSKSESSGEYKITAVKPGFGPQSKNTFINDGEMSVVNFNLEKL